jgi:ribonuclease PH
MPRAVANSAHTPSEPALACAAQSAHPEVGNCRNFGTGSDGAWSARRAQVNSSRRSEVGAALRRAASALQQNGRTLEIQRLIGRSLRTVADFTRLGERTIYIDCDVLSADGGTRVASIIGATVALYDADRWLVENGKIPSSALTGLVAAISVGVLGGEVLVDLAYAEDSTAEVDMNIVMTDAGRLVEVQGTAERQTFDRAMLDVMLDSAEPAIRDIISIQKETLGL